MDVHPTACANNFGREQTIPRLHGAIRFNFWSNSKEIQYSGGTILSWSFEE